MGLNSLFQWLRSSVPRLIILAGIIFLLLAIIGPFMRTAFVFFGGLFIIFGFISARIMNIAKKNKKHF